MQMMTKCRWVTTIVREKQKVGVVDDGNAEMHHDLESEEALFKHT